MINRPTEDEALHNIEKYYYYSDSKNSYVPKYTKYTLTFIEQQIYERELQLTNLGYSQEKINFVLQKEFMLSQFGLEKYAKKVTKFLLLFYRGY